MDDDKYRDAIKRKKRELIKIEIEIKQVEKRLLNEEHTNILKTEEFELKKDELEKLKLSLKYIESNNNETYLREVKKLILPKLKNINKNNSKNFIDVEIFDTINKIEK